MTRCAPFAEADPHMDANPKASPGRAKRTQQHSTSEAPVESTTVKRRLNGASLAAVQEELVAAYAPAGENDTARAGSVTNPPAFPIEALGDILGDAAGAIAAQAQCSPSLVAQSVLSAAALAVQGHYDAADAYGQAHPCSLMFMTLGVSGERKSTADRYAVRAFQCHADEAGEGYKRLYAEWKDTCAAKQAARKNAQGPKPKKTWQDIEKALSEIGEDPPPPLHPKRVVAEPNTEGLLKFMQSSHGSMAWFNNEAGQSIGGTAFADDNKLKLGATLSKFWDGDPLDQVRSGDGLKELVDRRLSVHLMVQPQVAYPFLADPVLREQGLFSRFLVCKPDSRIGQRLFKEKAADFEQRLAPYEKRLEELLKREAPHKKRANELNPKLLPWSSDARLLWIEFHDDIEASMAAGGALAERSGFGAKLAENVYRIATVLQVFNDEAAGEITGPTMFSAIRIGEFYRDEILRLEAATGADVEETYAGEVRNWIAKWTETHINVRVLQRLGPPAGRKNNALAKRAIDLLADEGILNSKPETACVDGKQSASARLILGRQPGRGRAP